MKKESACKRYSIPFQLTGSFSSPARSGWPEFCSLFLISAARKCSAFYSSWHPSPLDDERPIALLVGHVRLRPSRVPALRKNSLRGQSAPPSQLDHVRPFHGGTGCVRWTFFDCMGTGIATKSGLGGSIVPDSSRHSDPSPSATTAFLVAYSLRISRRAA